MSVENFVGYIQLRTVSSDLQRVPLKLPDYVGNGVIFVVSLLGLPVGYEFGCGVLHHFYHLIGFI